MPEQFKDITSFKAYQKQIYEYLNNRMVQVPLFFENQNAVNNTTLPSATSQIGGNFQQTIRDGKVVKGKRINEIFTSFDNVYSNNQDDLSIIEYIAYKLNGLTPHEAIIDVDAFIYEGTNTTGLIGPISTMGEIPQVSNYVYIPYVDLKNVNEKLLLNYNSGLDTLQDYFNTLDVPGANFENFKTQLIAKKINLSARKYNLSDNTSNFLPVGVQKRRVSKKVLQDNSETTINELLPETDAYLVRQFFKQWEKTKSKIESGQEFIEGSTFLKAGNFAGGIGPGNYNFWLNENTDGIPINNITPEPEDYDYFEENPNISLTNTWSATNRISAIESQRVIEEENPGMSQFVYSSQRNSPVWYTINVEDKLNNFIPGVTYTLSGWQAQDGEFNPSNFEELNPGRFFFFKLDAVMDDGSIIPVIEFPSFDLTLTDTLPSISGQAVEVWQGSEKVWTRYKKTFTIPVDEANNPVDSSGNIIDNLETGGEYKLTWFLGYQNSVVLPDAVGTGLEPIELYNGALEFGGVDGSTEPSNIWDGPTLRSNTNIASEYYTGLRLNVGDQITGITKLPLQNIQTLSIARILQDCVKLLEPDFPLRNVPIYSEAKLQELILSQQNTALIASTLNEIKQGLINALKSFIDGSSSTYGRIAESLLNNTDSDGNIDTDTVLTQLKTDFDLMLQATNIKSQLESLENVIISTFSAVTTNLTGLVTETSLDGYYQTLPGITEVGAPGFKQLDGTGILFGVHFGLSYNQENLIGDQGVDVLMNNNYNSPTETDGSELLPLPQDPNAASTQSAPFYLNHITPGVSYNFSLYKSRNDWFVGNNGTAVRNFVSTYKEPFIFIHKHRYKLPFNAGASGGKEILNDPEYVLPGVGGTDAQYGLDDVFQVHSSGDFPYELTGEKYNSSHFHNILNKYLYNNTTTPIGAFYTSEMITGGIFDPAAKGYTNQYNNRPNNYPGTGYGPYSAPNLFANANGNTPDDNTDFGYQDGIERTKVIYQKFLEKYRVNDELFVQANTAKQFFNLNNLFQDADFLEEAVSLNPAFAELETYTLDFYSGLELVGFCYPYLLNNDASTGFGGVTLM